MRRPSCSTAASPLLSCAIPGCPPAGLLLIHQPGRVFQFVAIRCVHTCACVDVMHHARCSRTDQSGCFFSLYFFFFFFLMLVWLVITGYALPGRTSDITLSIDGMASPESLVVPAIVRGFGYFNYVLPFSRLKRVSIVVWETGRRTGVGGTKRSMEPVQLGSAMPDLLY